MKTQHQQIIDYYKDNEKLTHFTALVKLGVANLPARIYELKAQGYEFSVKKKTKTNRNGRKISYFEYYLTAAPQDEKTGAQADELKGV